MRADLSGALPSGVRVVREAPTYLLCAIDADEATLAALGRREDAAAAVADAEERVRAALSRDHPRACCGARCQCREFWRKRCVDRGGSALPNNTLAKVAEIVAMPIVSFDRGRPRAARARTSRTAGPVVYADRPKDSMLRQCSPDRTWEERA